MAKIWGVTAEDIWKELKDRFQQSNGPRVFQLKREIMNVQQGGDTVSAYFKKLKVLWEELANYNMHCTCGLCTCGGAKETEHIMTFLMGLNDDFSQIRGQILLMDPIPNVNRIFSLIIQEERQRSVSVNQSQSPLVFNIRDGNGSKSTNNNQYKNFKKSQVYCTHCK